MTKNAKMKQIWMRLLSTRRYMGKDSPASETSDPILPPVDEEGGRSQFQKDIDRIIFSRPFRRLAKKTQVHPMSKSDHMHTRLTHSIEVANVGKTLGTKVGHFLHDNGMLPDGFMPHNVGEIVQAACFAHDIGNTPFGHAGEEAIKECLNESLILEIDKTHDIAQEFVPNLPFEANAHGFRIIAKLQHNRDQGGMRLTYATLGTFMKYPYVHDGLEKFGAFPTEREDLDRVASELGLVERKGGGYCRHPLAYLVEAADDMCNRIMDLEDGVEAKLLKYDEFRKMFWRTVGNGRTKEKLEGSLYSQKEKMAIIRSKAIHSAVNGVVETFEQNMKSIIEGKGVRKFNTQRGYADNILLNCSVRKVALIFQEADKKVKGLYEERRKVELEAGSFVTMQTLLGNCLTAFFSWKKKDYRMNGELPDVPLRNRHIFLLMGDECPKQDDNGTEGFRRCIDFVAGMTDDFAARLAQRLVGGVQD